MSVGQARPIMSAGPAPGPLPLCPASFHFSCLQGWLPRVSVSLIPLLSSSCWGVRGQWHPYRPVCTWEGCSTFQRPGQMERKGWRKSRLRPYSSHLWAVEAASQFPEGLAAILLHLGPWDGVLIGLIPRRCVFPSASCWPQHLLCLRE